MSARHQPGGFFVLRTPLLPWQAFTGWSALSGDAGDQSDDDPAVRSRLRRALAEILDDPTVTEALQLASPGLAVNIPLWRAQPDSERGAKVERALVKYLSRMCFRPTPFGLFAGVSLGSVGGRMRLEIGASSGHRKRSQLGFGLLNAVARRGRQRLLAAGELRLQGNPTLHRAGERLRFLQPVSDAEGGAATGYQLVAVEASPAIDRVLALTATGATVNQLADALADEDSSAAEARAFVQDLREAGLLVDNLGPAVCGGDPHDQLSAALAAHPSTKDLQLTLQRARSELQRIDDAAAGSAADGYRALVQALLGPEAEAASAAGDGPLVHVDLVKSGPPLAISPALADHIRAGAELLWRLIPPGDDPLAGFRAELAERHGEAEVPLLEVLDDDLGVGFPPPEPGPPPAFSQRDAHLLRRVVAAQAAGQDELRLDSEDLAALALPAAPIPDAWAALVVLSGASQENGPVAHVDSVDGPAGAALLGRFCRALPGLQAHVRAHLEAEAACQPDVVFAEVVHLPSGQAFAGVSRPDLRAMHIPCFASGGAGPEGQIPLSDLTVAVQDQRVVLRSRRLAREVRPRFTAAHDERASPLPVYRFLRALGRQDGRGGRCWQWGCLDALDHLPRVRAGRVTLALARWRLRASELAALDNGTAGRLHIARQLRAARGLPRLIALEDGDNPLVIDLENPLSLDVLAHAVRDRASVLVHELAGDASAVVGPEGAFCHELVLPFVRDGGADATAHARPPAPAPVATPAVPRRFVPGSAWLYARLYTGVGLADQILAELVGPLIDELSTEQDLNDWHFLRNRDPGFHLRLRLHLPGSPDRALPVLHRRLQPFLADGRVHRLVLDTYQREVERYGGPAGIELSERIFTADSRAALRWLGAARAAGGPAPDERWAVLTLASDRLLDDFGFSEDQRRTLLAGLAAGYASEGSAAGSERQVAAFFREQRATLERQLRAPAPDETERRGLWQALAARSDDLRPAIAGLRALSRSGGLSVSLPDLAAALLHMQAGRLMAVDVRMNEHLAYSCLLKLDRGRRARRQPRLNGERA